jgi:long-subunit fatty acid transport protein
MIKKTLFLLLLPLSLFSQEGTFSPYSFFGIGNETFKGTAENRSMGGISSFSDSIHLNLQNPAAYSKLRLTTFSVGATANSLNLDNGSETDQVNFSTVDYIAIGIPFKKFGLGFGLKPLSAVGYEIQSLEGDVARSLNGRGGLNTVYLSGGIDIVKNLSLGFTAKYNFGDIENKNILAINQIERASREINSSNINGFNYDLGLQYQFKLLKKYTMRLSAGFSPETALNIENDRQLATIVFGNDGSEVIVDQSAVDNSRTTSTLNLGWKINTGIGIGQDRRWYVGLEYTQQDAGDFSAINFNNNQDLSFIDRQEFKIGGFYIPRYNSPRSYFNRVTYRAGFRYSQTGLDFRGESIDEFGISFGLGLPAGRYFTNINVGFEYWIRGTTNNSLIQENYLSLFVSFSFNDLWFQKPKYN